MPTPTKTDESGVATTPVDCGLHRPLGECPLKRSGQCDSLYDVLQFLFPPFAVRALVREHLASDREAQAWLARLDAALPGGRGQRDGWH
jgi:hypothetical protein